MTLMLLVLISILALICGSFIGMLSYRLPIMLEREWNQAQLDTSTEQRKTFNLFLPASHCTACNMPIAWYTNIPLIGYFISAGQCKYCQSKISMRYLWIELCMLIATLIFVYFLLMTDSSVLLNSVARNFNGGDNNNYMQYIIMLILLTLIISLSVIDIEQGLLPDVLTYTLLWTGLIVSNLGYSIALANAIWGAVLGYFILWLLYQIMKIITGREGMGYGDFKYLAAIGAWVGWLALPLVLLIASISAIIYAIARRLISHTELNIAIRFGPFLSISFYCYLVWGNWIITLMQTL